MLKWSICFTTQRRVGWFKCSCGGGRDQLRGHPMSFCFGTPGKSGGHAVGVMEVGVCRPAKFKELGLLLCWGQTALHSTSLRAREEREKGSAEIVQGPASSLLVHPSTLETHCVWQSKLGICLTSKAENRIDKTGIIITPRHCWADMNIKTIKEQWKTTKERFSSLWLWVRLYTFKTGKYNRGRS